jgi:hypothetical protein
MNVFHKVIWVLGLVTFAAALAGQKVVDNPAKPAAKNAGRTVALEEIVTVRDGGEEFYFEQGDLLSEPATNDVCRRRQDVYLSHTRISGEAL